MVLSSFYTRYGVDNVRLEGLPDGLSDCKTVCQYDCDECRDKSLPKFVGYDPDGVAYPESKEGFTRVHRDKEIISAMQKWMDLS